MDDRLYKFYTGGNNQHFLKANSEKRFHLDILKGLRGLVWFAIYLLNDFRNVTRSAAGERQASGRRAARARRRRLSSDARHAAGPTRCRRWLTSHTLTTRTFVVIFHLDMHIQRNNKSFEAIPSQPNEMTLLLCR